MNIIIEVNRMKPISKIAAAIRPSATMAVDSKAKQMKADGFNIIGFGAGEPDFSTPDNIKLAGIQAIIENKTRYTPAAGIVPLRQAIAQRLKSDCSLDYDYTQIVVASGAKHNVYLSLAALVNPGDEVILPAPFWLSYGELIPMVGGVPVIVTAGEDQGFKLSANQLEAAITDKTKAVIINNPSNPAGMVYSRAELEAIANVCLKHDLYVIADEIYYKLVFDSKEFISFASLGEEIKERTIVINGVSKCYCMTGWRLGYSASSAYLAKVMSNFVGHSTGAPSTVSQYAAIEALTGQQDSIESMRIVFQQRRDYLYKRINQIDGVSCIKPEGAFYIMMNIEGLIGRKLGGRIINSSDDFAQAFLETSLVAVVPCTGFGLPNFVRWTYAASMEDIKEGCDRLEKFVCGD